MASKQEASLINKALDLMKTAPVEVVMGFQETLKQGMKVVVEIEAEKTKRADISLRRDEMLADYELRRKALELYLDRSFNERAEVLKQKFIALERAMDLGNNEVAIAALGAIVDTMRASPLTNGGVVREMISARKTLVLE